MRQLVFIIAMLILFNLHEPASAQQEVTIDHVTNSAVGHYLFAGRTHVFNIRFTNFAVEGCTEFSYVTVTGFVISSPDGATWNHTIGAFADAWHDMIWVGEFINHLEDPVNGSVVIQGDGISPDYFNFAGVNLGASPPWGLVHGFDDIVFEVEIVTNIADTNLNICIDKSELGKLNRWSWFTHSSTACEAIPNWSGQRCYTIINGCCVGRRGNIDLDPNGTADIADMTFLIDHLFINFPSLPCRDQANVDADPDDKVDIADLTMLIDHLFINFPALPFCP